MVTMVPCVGHEPLYRFGQLLQTIPKCPDLDRALSPILARSLFRQPRITHSAKTAISGTPAIVWTEILERHDHRRESRGRGKCDPECAHWITLSFPTGRWT